MRPDKKKVRHHDSRKKAAAAKQKTEGPQQEKPRRVIESNWEADKPDLPDENSDEGDGSSGVFTGLDFNYVLENSLTADALLRTKAELEWERERQDVFTTEHFSMDLANLEKAMACVPIHHQLGIDSLSNETVRQFNTEAETARKSFSTEEMVEADEVNSRILAALKLSMAPGGTSSPANTAVQKSPQPSPIKQPQDSNPEDPENENLEEWLDDFLAS